ncbi:hypothetical protein HN695_05920 [Candidatus Woesearchaeota archaeon]|mgnify:CR=1 FL=1|jgi:hypothetical protein|nr:hypothetical protein [Candidatus Woesearchaeota archaeon]MBT5272582.1 hypothetical protein [Candidatus Woesearchaeota archaeon]MBT6040561.1 hypothetical protein [Candidatus Woesearchaeota archaeon]MBT6337134.1 hypothetical protein [Candidatus Woesearchaeota archaeon]MBT7927846.1 hypothetical protein [Candidatus Woesearchaeota archaeon]
MQTNNQNQKKNGRLERITESTTFKRIKKGAAITYGIILVGAFIGVIGYNQYQEHIASKTKACQEIECKSSPYFECSKSLVEKEKAENCAYNKQGIEECCVCTCDYTMY